MDYQATAINVHRLNLDRLRDSPGLLYDVAFFAGQVQHLLECETSDLFNEMKAAFEAFYEAYCEESGEYINIELYMDDITKGLEIGALYPVSKLIPGKRFQNNFLVKKGTKGNPLEEAQRITEECNPLYVEHGIVPYWMMLEIQRQLKKNTTMRDALADLIYFRFPRSPDYHFYFLDHWGRDRTKKIFVTEPYNLDEERVNIFCRKMGAAYRLGPHAYHHPHTTRVEIFQVLG
jgi:hypothetical protein